MQKKLKLAVLAMCCAPSAFAQTAADSIGFHSEAASEAAFTFTEAQLGEDDDMTQNVTIVNSNTMPARWAICSHRHVSAIVHSIRSTTKFISTDCC